MQNLPFELKIRTFDFSTLTCSFQLEQYVSRMFKQFCNPDLLSDNKTISSIHVMCKLGKIKLRISIDALNLSTCITKQ